MSQDTTQNTSDQRPSTSSAYVRHEYFLGPVRCVALPETVHQNGRAVRSEYQLNVVDGWVRLREWTDESGVVWQGQHTTASRVGRVLDAAPEHAEFLAESHLRWVQALRRAGHGRRARRQRRALDQALRRHGLALMKAPQPRGD